MKCDVAIVGGGPAGSTAGALLKKYRPSLDVVILERDSFPRDHVGESQLPAIGLLLHEMGVWDKVEAAGFPIKIGATYRWGCTSDLWNFNFLPNGELSLESRPARYEGQRKRTAFQVDRAVYDKILLDHCRELGCRVYESTRVSAIQKDGDSISSLELSDGQSLTAEYYVDASGASGLFRKAFGVEISAPTSLRNIAVWDYWQDAEWAYKTGTEGTKIQIMSLGWGWLWFITISNCRTSVGLVTSADYYKSSGESTESLYLRAISEEPTIREFLTNARREEQLSATKDWSFIADRLTGENWFLAGDAGGFADPILSAGMTLAQAGAKRVAYSILELLESKEDEAWVKRSYEAIQTQNIRNHIMLADYWYSANGVFTDLKEYCTKIAETAGINLDPESAFAWLSTGGFTSDLVGLPFSATFRLGSVKGMVQQFSGRRPDWSVFENNVFVKNCEGAVEEFTPLYWNGLILRVRSLVRDGKKLPLHLVYKYVWDALDHESEITYLAERFILEARKANTHLPMLDVSRYALECLESLVLDGWVIASESPALSKLPPTLMGSIGVR